MLAGSSTRYAGAPSRRDPYEVSANIANTSLNPNLSKKIIYLYTRKYAFNLWKSVDFPHLL